MEEFEMLADWTKVEAPPGFERSVLSELSRRKQRRKRARRMRLMMAGVAVPAAALVMVLVTGISGPDPGRRASIRADETTPLYAPGARRGGLPTIPITEAVSYSKEIRTRRRDSRTIYILEQVSDKSDTGIMF